MQMLWVLEQESSGQSAWTPTLVEALGRDCSQASAFRAFPAKLEPLAARCWAGGVCGSHLTQPRVQGVP